MLDFKTIFFILLVLHMLLVKNQATAKMRAEYLQRWSNGEDRSGLPAPDFYY
jgi:hypothetical protein